MQDFGILKKEFDLNSIEEFAVGVSLIRFTFKSANVLQFLK